MCWQSCFPFGASVGGDSVSLSSVASTGCIPLLEDPFQPVTDSFRSLHPVTLPIWLSCPFSFAYKDACDYLGPTHIIQDNLHLKFVNLIHVNSFCHVSLQNHRFWELGHRPLGWGVLLCLPQRARLSWRSLLTSEFHGLIGAVSAWFVSFNY